MAITVKHSGGVAGQVAGSFSGGMGKRQAGDALELYKMAEQGDQQAQQQLYESWQKQMDRQAQLARGSAPVGSASQEVARSLSTPLWEALTQGRTAPRSPPTLTRR